MKTKLIKKLDEILCYFKDGSNHLNIEYFRAELVNRVYKLVVDEYTFGHFINSLWETQNAILVS